MADHHEKITPDHDKKNMNQETPGTAAESMEMTFQNIIDNNMIEDTIISCAEHENINIYDCKISQFKAILLQSGSILFPKDKNILKIKIETHNNNNIPVYNYVWDIRKLKIICDIYLYISYKYNKIISFSYYSLLCNSNYFAMKNVLNNISDYNNMAWGTEFNNLKNYIIKRLSQDREEYIKESCIETPGAIGKIAVANTEYGWNLTPGQKAINTADNNILSLGQLPTLKAIGTAENSQNSDILSD